MYVPGSLKLEDIFPQVEFEQLSHRGKNLWLLFDNRLLWTADRLIEIFGPATLNTWKDGGEHIFRGWRPFSCGYGNFLSQHKWGRALDMDFEKVSSEEVRQSVLQNPWRNEYKYITCMEFGIEIFHYDTRNHNKNRSGIRTVKRGPNV